MDESDEPDSEDEKQKQMGEKEERESVPLEGLLFHKGERSISDISGEKGSDDDFDHNKFMEQMINKHYNDEADQKTKDMQQ